MNLRRHGPALLALLGVVGLAFWPAPLLLLGGAAVIGHPVGDLADHYWGTWWFGHQLLQGALPTATDLVQYPGPVRLWYVDPLGATLALLLRPFGAPAAYNGMVLLQATLAAGLAYLTGWKVSGSRSAGLIAGVYVGSHPYLLGLSWSGLTEYLGLAPAVAFIAALGLAMGQHPDGGPAPRRAPEVAGLLLALCALQAFYYAAFGAVLVGCAVLGPGWRGRLITAARIGGVFAVAGAPLFLLAWSTLTHPDAAVTTANAPGWTYRELPATDLLTFIRPGDYYFPDTRTTNPGILHVNYLGWVGLALAAFAVHRERGPLRALALTTGLYAVLSLGPRLCVQGEMITWGSGSIPLPLAALYVPGSPFRFVHHPYRMVAFLVPLVALLAARGARHLPRLARGGLAIAVVAEALWVSPAPWPNQTTDVEAPAIYATLPEGAVLDWPPDATTWNRRYELWQVTHHRPIAYGVNTFLPDRLREDPLVNRLLRGLNNLDLRARNRDVRASGRLLPPMTQGETTLTEMGYRSIILHGEALSEGERRQAIATLTEIFGEPAQNQRSEIVWLLSSSSSP